MSKSPRRRAVRSPPKRASPKELKGSATVTVQVSDKRHPKVGKTYKLKQVENRTEVEEGEQPERGLFEATVDFKSAKLVVVKVHLLDEVGAEVSCDGSAIWSLKREP